MDGLDVQPVEVDLRLGEQCFRVMALLLGIAVTRQQHAQRIATEHTLACQAKGVADEQTHPVFQLGGGGLRERHHQHFFQGETILHHQADRHQRDGEGLARTGAGLDEIAL